ncbi:polyphenol oxidase family protein [Comamonas odontotermitis]|uniref:polyphenol oxidase family protein n=1 Tax=Comamonas odontotermitis TaxID=379895 RepID=UPI003751594F
MDTAFPQDWIIPDWPAPARVHALCTTRKGGFSSGLFGTTNLSLNVGDEAAHVLQNRALLAQAMQALETQKALNGAAGSPATVVAGASPPSQPVFVRQVHGTEVKYIDQCATSGQDADASVSDTPGMGCAVMAADCLPVIFSHANLPVVGAAHAGWRGLVGQGGVGVLETCFAAYAQLVRKHLGQDMSLADIAAQTLAWLGPCISQPEFEVGPEVQAAFVEHDASAAACFAAGKPGKFQADLSALARHRLQRQGITRLYGNDSSPVWCTVRNPERFFSHRRDGVPGVQGGSGRFAACVWVA